MYTLKEFAKYNKVTSLVINKRNVTVRSDDTRKIDYHKDAYDKTKAIVKSFGKLNMDNIKADTKDDGYELSLNYWELTKDEQMYVVNGAVKWFKIVYSGIDTDTSKVICLAMVVIEIAALTFVLNTFGYKLGIYTLVLTYPIFLIEAWYMAMTRR